MGYYVPDSMRVGQTYEASLTLGHQIDSIKLFQSILADIKDTIEDEEVKIHTVNIGRKMKATLNDQFGKPGENFLISCTPDTVQDVDLKLANQVKWVWNIKPLTEGEKRLTMNLWILIEENGEKISHAINVYNGDITVLSLPVKPRWPWALTALLPLFGWLLFRFRKKLPGSSPAGPQITEEEFRLIEEAIADGDIGMALQKLKEKTSQATDGSKEKVFGLASRLSELLNQKVRNIIPPADFDIGRSRITDDLLHLLREFRNT
jgi:hypothetical protein